MEEFRIRPIYGLKTSVPNYDFSLYVDLGSYLGTYDTGGKNISYTRTLNAAVKSFGIQQWSITCVSGTDTN